MKSYQIFGFKPSATATTEAAEVVCANANSRQAGTSEAAADFFRVLIAEVGLGSWIKVRR
jgi:hypothetical protein